MKFKIWLTKLGRYLDGSEWYINPSGKLYFEDIMDGVLVAAPESSYKVLRFTELHDLYGQEIYEGDIVKLYYHHPNIIADEYEIKYAFGRWMLDDWDCLSEHFLDNTKKFGDVCRVVKIGNVYEKRIYNFTSEEQRTIMLDICKSIYMARNISLSEETILRELEKIDSLFRDGGYNEEEEEEEEEEDDNS